MKMKGKENRRHNDRRKRRGDGPRLTDVQRKELGIDTKRKSSSDSDLAGEEDARDFYEFDEEVAQEESGKNRKFDEEENYEFELSQKFKDEEVPSDEGKDEEISSNKSEYDSEDEDHEGVARGI